MEKALLCVSFGTSVPEAEESIAAVENALRAAAPGRLLVRAYTSSMICRKLAGRGETVLSVQEAFQQLAEQGVSDVLVQPTHLLRGSEYDKVRTEAALWRERFSAVRLGAPLLAGTEDLRAFAGILDEAYPARQGQALVLFGHGTDVFANMVYPALQTALHLLGRTDIVVGTVEGWPGFPEVLEQLRRQDRQQVHLVPLMLVAGDHAMHDMAGSGDSSWKSRLEAEGYAVTCTMQGLGMLPAVQELYCRHMQAQQE